VNLVAIESERAAVSTVALAWIFLRIGAVAFGGLLSTLALIERELVVERPALTREEITEAVAHINLLPGSGGPQTVAYLGCKLGGWVGSAVATTAFLLPGVLVMLALSIGYVALEAVPMVSRAIAGLLAAVVGVQAVTAYRFARSGVKNRAAAAIAVAAVFASLILHVNSAIVVLLAGIVGAIFLSPPAGTPITQNKS
jgi:chromate transporter